MRVVVTVTVTATVTVREKQKEGAEAEDERGQGRRICCPTVPGTKCVAIGQPLRAGQAGRMRRAVPGLGLEAR